jgi:DNA-binding transcriptional LysR family regulator
VPRIRHEVEETSTLITLVAAGLGVAVVPEPTVALGIPGVRYRSLAGPTPPTMDLLVAHSTRASTPLVERASTILRRIAEAGRRPA